MNIPRYFCWTRFGTEAAQPIAEIIDRKEEERRSADGVFLWGIGNAVGRSIVELLRVSERPAVLFSSIKSAPKQKDIGPPAVAVWTAARGLDERPFPLPQRALVTSRFDPDSPKRVHYALVCYSDQPLRIAPLGRNIQLRALCNLVTKRPLGASQVTAVVEHKDDHPDDSEGYEIAIRAHLVAPYFIRLHHPIPFRCAGTSASRTLDLASLKEEPLEDQLFNSRQMQLAFSTG
jgi:hypothetical protein